MLYFEERVHFDKAGIRFGNCNRSIGVLPDGSSRPFDDYVWYEYPPLLHFRRRINHVNVVALIDPRHELRRQLIRYGIMDARDDLVVKIAPQPPPLDERV